MKAAAGNSNGLPYGLQAMLKEGYKHLSGLEEAVLKNIEACKQLSMITRTSMGPNGMNKLVINHLDKIFLTSDACTIVNELEVQHPAAKMLAMAAAAQQQEIGDGTNFVLSFAGELLKRAEDLLRDGLHPVEIADGYARAGEMALKMLDDMVVPGTDSINVSSVDDVVARITGSMSSKLHGYEKVLAPLVADACVSVLPKNEKNFSVDNVRVVKIQGGSIHNSTVIKGLVLKRGVEGTVKCVEDAKVAVFAQGVDTLGTETKGTVLIKSAEELENYSKGEEDKVENAIKELVDAGVKVVASGGSFGELALHFLDKYGLMAVKIPSKFDLRRFSRATGAPALVSLAAPKQDEIGFAKSLQVKEIGGVSCLVLEQAATKSAISTIILRGATTQSLDDLERAVDGGINAFRALTKDGRAVPAGGATEIEIARNVIEMGQKEKGLDQYAITQFGHALEVIPRTIAENSGLDATDAIAALYAAHAEGKKTEGLDITTGQTKDLGETDTVYDLYVAKWWGMKLAVDAATTVLRVDQIIMSRPAGGPRPPQAGPFDED
jgi:T-complex protein 1 subunit theta